MGSAPFDCAQALAL